jgi:hypothetical protein
MNYSIPSLVVFGVFHEAKKCTLTVGMDLLFKQIAKKI